MCGERSPFPLGQLLGQGGKNLHRTQSLDLVWGGSCALCCPSAIPSCWLKPPLVLHYLLLWAWGKLSSGNIHLGEQRKLTQNVAISVLNSLRCSKNLGEYSVNFVGMVGINCHCHHTVVPDWKSALQGPWGRELIARVCGVTENTGNEAITVS